MTRDRTRHRTSRPCALPIMRPAAVLHRAGTAYAYPIRCALPLLAALVLASPALAEVQGPLPQDNPEALRLIEASAVECAAEEAGALVVNDGAYVAEDLDADGDDDLVLNFDHIHCQYSMAQWAGTGGTPKWFILDGTTSIEIWGGTWTIVDVSPFEDEPETTRRLILMPVHGTYCDGFGAQSCWRVITTYEGTFSTMPELPE